jgi:hypothetical protein
MLPQRVHLITELLCFTNHKVIFSVSPCTLVLLTYYISQQTLPENLDFFIIFKYLRSFIMLSEFGLVNEVSLIFRITIFPQRRFNFTHFMFPLLHFLVKYSHCIFRVLLSICKFPGSNPCQLSLS